MKILHTIDSLAPEKGGTSRSVPRLTNALIHQGVEVTLVDGRALREMREQVDVIHDHGVWLPSNHRSASLASSRRVPFVVSPRGMLEPWSMRHRRWKKQLAWTIYQRRDVQRASMLHATSSMEATNLRGLGFRQPIAVIPNGVDVPPPGKLVPRNDTVRTALFLSRIHPKKGVLDLIAAWARVLPRDWRLVIAGPSENGHRDEVRKAVHAADIDNVVSFVGEIDDSAKWAWHAAADLFVLPSYSENFGTVVAESLASGVPVITTTATPWEELHSHDCGWWIEPGAESLIHALQQATSVDSSVRSAMGARGRALVESKYGWARVGADMRAAYEWLLHRGPAPSFMDLV